MTRILLLSLIAVSLSFLFVGVGMAETPEAAPMAEQDGAAQAVPVCQAEAGKEVSFPVTAEDLLPSPSFEDCSFEDYCPEGCFCLKIRNQINCYC